MGRVQGMVRIAVAGLFLAAAWALPVSGPALAAAQGGWQALSGEVRVGPGEVWEGPLRLGMGSLKVEGRVTGPVEVALGEAEVGGEVGPLRVGAGEVRIEGQAGPVEVGVGQVTVRGRVAGDIRLGMGEVRLLPGAQVQGNVEVGMGAVARGPGVQVGGRVSTGGQVPFWFPGSFLTLEWHRGPLAWIWSNPVWHLIQWAGLFVLAALTLAVTPGVVQAIAAHLAAAPLRAAGVGLLILAGVPAVLVLLVVTLVGVLLIPLVLLALAVGKFLGYVAVSLWLGDRLATVIPQLQGNHGRAFWRLLVGSLALALAGLLPVAGPAVAVAGALLGLGAVALAALEQVRAWRR